MTKKTMNIQRLAFTLIELLVVIVIIAVITGVSMPVYQSFILSANTTKSIANLRQIGIGLTSYVDENKDRLPIGLNENGDSDGNQLSYASALLPYLSIADDNAEFLETPDTIFYSPTSKEDLTVSGSTITTTTPTTYSVHPDIFPSLSGGSSRSPATESLNPNFQWAGGTSMLGHYYIKIKNSAELIFVAEGSQVVDTNNNASDVVLREPSSYFATSRTANGDLNAAIPETEFNDEDSEVIGQISFRNKGEATACLMGDMSVRTFHRDSIKARNLIFFE